MKWVALGLLVCGLSGCVTGRYEHQGMYEPGAVFFMQYPQYMQPGWGEGLLKTW